MILEHNIFKIKPIYKFGLLNSIIGLLVGLFHYFFIAIGKGYELFIFSAPIAVFIISILSWKIKIKNREYNRGDLITLSFIIGTLSHPTTFFLCIVYSNIEFYVINVSKSKFYKPIDLLTGIPASLFYSIFSLIIYGWFTVSASILISIYMTSNKKSLGNI